MHILFASTDPVALDQACLDLVYAAAPADGNTGKKFPETDEDRGDYLHIRVPSFFFTEEGESPAISLNILLKCDKSLNPQE